VSLIYPGLLAVLLTFTLTPQPASSLPYPRPEEECPELCSASAAGQTYGSDFTVQFSNVTDGNGKAFCQATCTNCKGTIAYAYTGSQRWRLSVGFVGGGGQSDGQGPTAGAFVVTSECDDLIPGGVVMEVGNPPVPGFTAQIFCPCL
jgi:hypothetical protein